MIELKNINKIYKRKNVRVLNNINIAFEEKGLNFIIGESGSGKTTLLSIIGGLDKPTTGEVIVNKKVVSSLNERELAKFRNSYVGYLFQENYLLEDLNVLENIVLPLKLQQKKINLEEVDSLLKKLKIDELKTRNIKELSGGEKSRVALAVALIKKPKILLCDEPTSSLDEETKKDIMDILYELSKEILVIVVTHECNNVCKHAFYRKSSH